MVQGWAEEFGTFNIMGDEHLSSLFVDVFQS